MGGIRRGFMALALLSATLATASGCGGDSEPPILKITTGAPPAYVAVRDRGAAEWTVLPINGASSFETKVAKEYEAVVVCERMIGTRLRTSVGMYQRSLDEDSDIQRVCGTGGNLFDITGTVTKPGQVGLHESAMGTSSPDWMLQLSAPAGEHDLVMLDGDYEVGYSNIGIRRGIAVNGNTDLGTIDFDREAMTPMESKTFTASNLQSGETLYGSVFLTTRGAALPVFDFRANGGTIQVAPESFLTSSDKQTVSLSATTEPADPLGQYKVRSISLASATTKPAVLPEPIGEVTFSPNSTGASATLAGVDDYDWVYLDQFLSSDDRTRTTSYFLVMSRDYREASRATAITLDLAQLPGFKSEWLPRPGDTHNMNLYANSGVYGEAGATEVGVSQSITLSDVLPRAPLALLAAPSPTQPPRLRTADGEPLVW